MTASFTDRLREWIAQVQPLHAEPAEHAQITSIAPLSTSSADCAGSAGGTSSQNPCANTFDWLPKPSVVIEGVTDIQPSPKVCRACGRSQWWVTLDGSSGLTCDFCHPVARSRTDVRWTDGTDAA